MSLAQVQSLAASTIEEVAAGKNLQEVLAALRHAHPELGLSEKGALQDIAYGCQRYAGSLRFMLSKMLNKPISNSRLESLLLVALYQLNHTRNAPHAVVNEAVENIARIGKGQYRSFANAILRRFLREKEALNSLCKTDDTAKYNYPQWWQAYLKNHYPKHWHNILAATMQPPPMTLRVNRRHGNSESYLKELEQAGLAGKALDDYAVRLHEAVSVNALPGFAEGRVSVQDWGAQQAAYLLKPQSGERILDACAAPGGKTGHLLEMADCQMTALDISPERMARVHSNLQRLGFLSENKNFQTGMVQLKSADAADLAGWYEGKPFDAILADVPCTASGVVKRNPDIKWLRRPGDALKTARQQEPLLDSLWSVLRPGGRMLLATCSLFEEENQQQLSRFLTRHADAQCSESRVLIPNGNQDGFYYALIHKQ
ncbi:MAG: 16S rRNA (cytosine(967)-C(5))-methyltransferase RsmB [Neisseria sp.]|uniref:16S rRNA (cytosine(967)-C(5))-methyltransferase RsmB n=1 Tax=Neisseria sp. TaxID=192066 RepID=UPI0026DCB46C|nr:16S rRNA (cytosine(967)-C(5))-methyltransferase RsmB [Neisseria sp.]MDO4249592.1 16S rRNA (cytosine(967)-C(5))-methyltransferase RsmB [Neisseria sp.]